MQIKAGAKGIELEALSFEEGRGGGYCLISSPLKFGSYSEEEEEEEEAEIATCPSCGGSSRGGGGARTSGRPPPQQEKKRKKEQLGSINTSSHRPLLRKCIFKKRDLLVRRSRRYLGNFLAPSPFNVERSKTKFSG